tara:strand:+ start:3726 stop:4088 length:363 start_codon:yes stop_codon:yes gene_type:complete
MQIYLLKTMPYYDSLNQSYKNILVLNKRPIGPLEKIIKRISLQKLSPFQTTPISCPPPSCVFAINSLQCVHDLMCEDEIPNLFEFLLNNNYVIDSQITKILQKTSVQLNGNLICMIKYEN